METDDLDIALHPFGLRQMGDFPEGARTTTLIGPDEPRFWPIFCQSAEYTDGKAHPMDRWSRRIITQIATTMNAEPVFPFGGPPYEPFYTWAVQSGRFWPSPIGFLVHDEAGLFASFRGAIRWQTTPKAVHSTKPCNTCNDTPCLSACPVGAFDDGYDVAACKAHVISDAGAQCRTAGCLARRACPVGQGNRLPAQAAFHMEAFL